MINFDYVKPSSEKAAIDALNKDALHNSLQVAPTWLT